MRSPGRDREGTVIGWREWVGLPDLGIEAVKAKVDTGARTSAVHAFDVERFRRRGRDMVRFKIHPLQRDSDRTVEAASELIDLRPVRTSGGHLSMRPVIRTAIQWLDRTWTIELTLAARDQMGFRMLLGREAIRGQFLVDPGRSYLGGRGPDRPHRTKPSRKAGP